MQPITREEWKELAERLREKQAYLIAVRRRLEARGVQSVDSIWYALDQASARMQDLRMNAHYKATSGTGSPQA